jgi:hypothetical protein
MEARMPIGMEVNLNDNLDGNSITGDGTAAPQNPLSADDLPALIAVRLRWDRRFKKDRTLDYTEKELPAPGGIINLKVHYGLTPHETKKVFVEIINKHNGQKLKSERRTFTGPVPL